MAPTLVVAGATGHGKTALVGALAPSFAATDADREPIDVIDLDTHDELVEALLAAGPLAIDAYVLVVAADDTVTQETREHAALLRALGVEHGLAVATRADMADPAGVLQEIGQLVPGAPAHAVSVATGDGLDGLRRAVGQLVAMLPARLAHPAARLAGDRPPAATRVIDAALDFGPHREREPDHGAQVVVHLRGRQAPARLARLGGRFWQVRLGTPLPARAGDRFVVRRSAEPPTGGIAPDPGHTLGGGVVLDPFAKRHPTSNEVIVRLTRISRGQAPLPPDPPRSNRH